MDYESFDEEKPSTSEDLKLYATTLPGTPCTTSSNGVSSVTCGGQNLPPLEAYFYCDHANPSSLVSQLSSLREDSRMCDVELVVEGKRILAHRCVIAAGIPYFRIMFTGNMIESRMDSIKINDITYEALKALIDYVYTSSIRIDSDNVQNLLFAASILQMDNVCGACQQFLSRFLTATNCLSIRQFAERHNCKDLLGSTEAFAIDHFSELCVNEEFMQIPFSHLKDLIMRDDLLIKCEEEVFEAIVSWVKFDETGRSLFFPELMTQIRWPQMTPRYLATVVKQNKFVVKNRACFDMVANAVFDILSPQDVAMTTSEKVNEEGVEQYAACSTNLNLTQELTLSPKRTLPRKSLAGVIFCAGGRGTVGVPFRTVEAFDWRKNIWITIPEMIQHRRHVGVVSAHGKLYAIGGHDGHMHLDSAEVFDPTIGNWRPIAPMATSRRGIAVAALDGAIYAVGGLDDQTCFPIVERYDIELDQWSEVAKMCTHRGGVGVTSFGKYLFAIGGNDGTHSLDSCERYDPLLNKWKMVKNMSNRRAGAGVAVLNGYIYAVGGFDDNAPLATCERYCMSSNTWEKLNNMSCPRGGVGVASMGGLLYAIGGHDGVQYLNTVECFDPVTNLWAPVANIKECRAGAGVSWANVRVDEIRLGKKDSGCSPFSGTQCM